MIAPDETTFAYVKGRPLAPEGALWEAALADWKTLHDKQVAENQTLQAAITKVQEAHLASEESHSANLAKMTEDQKFYMATAQAVIEKRDATIAGQNETIESLTARIDDLAAKPVSLGNRGLSVRERDSLLKMIIGSEQPDTSAQDR